MTKALNLLTHLPCGTHYCRWSNPHNVLTAPVVLQEVMQDPVIAVDGYTCAQPYPC